VAKHDKQANEQQSESFANGTAEKVYQFQPARFQRVRTAIGTMKIKGADGSSMVFGKPELTGEQYKGLDYLGNKLPTGVNDEGSRFVMYRPFPYPMTSDTIELSSKIKTADGSGRVCSVNDFSKCDSKEELLKRVNDLYDDVRAYDEAEKVASVTGMTGEKAFASLVDQGTSVAEQILEALAYGWSLHLNSKMRKAMEVVAEEQLRNENAIGKPTTKPRKVKVVEDGIEDGL
jgi:hypothetical protein